MFSYNSNLLHIYAIKLLIGLHLRYSQPLQSCGHIFGNKVLGIGAQQTNKRQLMGKDLESSVPVGASEKNSCKPRLRWGNNRGVAHS